jgi:hypothetical protein
MVEIYSGSTRNVDEVVMPRLNLATTQDIDLLFTILYV